MTNRNTHLMGGEVPSAARPHRVFGGLWPFGAALIAVFVMLPIAAVIWIAFTPTENIWGHLLATTLPRYLRNTAILTFGTGALAGAVGTGAAWLVTMYRFPLSRLIEWLLLLPLAIPAYVGAYALVDFLDYAGPVQIALREVMGWSNAKEYWFPEIRSYWAAIIVLSAALYPYVYMLARAAFREQSGGSYEVARALGSGPIALFWRVGLPLARPAIAAGTAIVMMETVNDFGVVDFFAIQTLTTGIFSVWLEAGNAGGAAQLSCLILVVIFCLVTMEKIGRRQLRFHAAARHRRPINPTRLPRILGIFATGLCLLPFVAGFVLPISVIAIQAALSPSSWYSPGLGQALANTILVCASAALLTVAASMFMVYGVRLSGSTAAQLLLPITTIGYSAPGAVLAVGILIPVAAFDNHLADMIQHLTGHDPGLIITGGAGVITLAFCVRFFAIAQGAVDGAFGRVAPSLAMAARSLGRTRSGALRDVYLPMMRGSVATALLLVFVDGVKELPATLLLRPFNFDTLATRVHEKASLENFAEAAPAALLVITVGLIAVGFLARANLKRE